MKAARGTEMIPAGVDRTQEGLLDVIHYAWLRCMMDRYLVPVNHEGLIDARGAGS